MKLCILLLNLGLEARIGYSNVKTSPVHFYVQRSSPYSKANSVIPWDLEVLNIGDAMNKATGVFTAPRDGIYHFTYGGIKDLTTNVMRLFLRLNGVRVASAYGASSTMYDSSSISSSLQLKNGDRVDLLLEMGTLHENPKANYDYFIGWLKEEDLQL